VLFLIKMDRKGIKLLFNGSLLWRAKLLLSIGLTLSKVKNKKRLLELCKNIKEVNLLQKIHQEICNSQVKHIITIRIPI
jgi:hypothetical protein